MWHVVEIFLLSALAWPQLEHVPIMLRSNPESGECPGENSPKQQPKGTGAVC